MDVLTNLRVKSIQHSPRFINKRLNAIIDIKIAFNCLHMNNQLDMVSS